MLVRLSLVLFISSPILAKSTLVSVVQVYRHGQRTPHTHYPSDPYSDRRYWPVGPGQLTNTGKTQQYELGKYTRQRYTGFLPEAYSSDFLYAESTDVDRTLMSAQTNLLGVFPPTASELWNPDIAWSPIPVHPSDPNVINPIPACNAYANEKSRVLANESYYQKIDSQYRETYEYLSTYSGSEISSLSDVGTIFDSLFIENEFGFALPEWTTAVFPEPLTTLNGYIFQSLAHNKKLARLSAGTFLNEVFGHFETMMANSSAEMFRMYSAHDMNIAQILGALDAFEPHAPYFASTIYFELWEFLGSYHVNMYYKNKDTVRRIKPKGCFSYDCNFNNVKKQLRDVLLDVDEWKTECAA